MLQVRDLDAGYGAVTVLHGVSLAAAPGAITALVGPNGAGKTTLMRAVAGLVPARRGEITLDGAPLQRVPPHDRPRHGVVLVPEGRHLFGDQSILDNLLLGASWRIRRDGTRAAREEALDLLGRYGARYRGWLPNARAPEVFARHLATVHVPRRFYSTILPGIPTIRVFEALACGIPLVSAPWDDSEGLFRPGEDFLFARSGEEMTRLLGEIKEDPGLRASLAASGLETIRARHTCAHRADELLLILERLHAPADMRLTA